MDSVALPSAEDAEIYIPTLTGSEPSSAHDNQAVQLSTICYSPAIGPPLVTARAASRVVADSFKRAPIVHYQTTFCTQVQFAHTTAFQYPPTPPVEAAEADKAQPVEALTIQHAGGESSENHLDKANAFPSLPTPPDMESISTVAEHAAAVPPNSSMAIAMAPSPGGKHQSVIAANWHQHQQQQQQQQQQTNIACFMPQQPAPMLPFPPHNGLSRRAGPQQQPMQSLYYQTVDRGCCVKRPSPPALLKDSELARHVERASLCSNLYVDVQYSIICLQRSSMPNAAKGCINCR